MFNAWMREVDGMTSQQESTLLHTLGLDRQTTSYRNYYCANADGDEICDQLVFMGLMRVGTCDDISRYYIATDKGIEKANELVWKRIEADRKHKKPYQARPIGWTVWSNTTFWAETRSKARYMAFLWLRQVAPDIQIIEVDVRRAR
ncbi:MAG: hypothetical protein BGO01_20690 [Armatimonadetes bacterium 55-13]|nr:MAG: hypothetical protein BGO01_20690 [Armatimonadetes bacterium 55-13]